MLPNKTIRQQIADRLRKRLQDTITYNESFSSEVFPPKKEDTILNFIIDRTLENALDNPSIEKLEKIEQLAKEGSSEDER